MQGAPIESGAGADIKPGNNLPLRNIPTVPRSTLWSCVRRRCQDGPLRRRQHPAAGQGGTYATLRMPSGEIRRVACAAAPPSARSATPSSRTSTGQGRPHALEGVRPTVRGVVMNPVDHPHGGGEGKTSGGRHPVSPWASPRAAPARTGERQAHRPSSPYRQEALVRRSEGCHAA